jgi:hypothetical protein
VSFALHCFTPVRGSGALASRRAGTEARSRCVASFPSRGRGESRPHRTCRSAKNLRSGTRCARATARRALAGTRRDRRIEHQVPRAEEFLRPLVGRPRRRAAAPRRDRVKPPGRNAADARSPSA